LPGRFQVQLGLIQLMSRIDGGGVEAGEILTGHGRRARAGEGSAGSRDRVTRCHGFLARSGCVVQGSAGAPEEGHWPCQAQREATSVALNGGQALPGLLEGLSGLVVAAKHHRGASLLEVAAGERQLPARFQESRNEQEGEHSEHQRHHHGPSSGATASSST
jgi:hypothetical protein